jgi:hypothetical protein
VRKAMKKLCICLKGLRKSKISDGRFSGRGDVDMQREMRSFGRKFELYDAARFAKLPWPIRAIGAMLDFVLRRTSPAV